MNKLEVYSDKGTYELFFNSKLNEILKILEAAQSIIIDKKVYLLYKNYLKLKNEKLIIVESVENNKTPEQAMYICEQLLVANIKRKHFIVAIGGGIIQDLVTFVASILFRGIDWMFFPTTLLAQSDSCIGGKSSLNFGKWKNILGNFYPPVKIFVQSKFLDTLSEQDIRSGVGEILKVHLLSGEDTFRDVQNYIKVYKQDRKILDEMILNALKLKNNILKIDPLDKGERLKMNYGHSFGHALEAATNFSIPHGIAVTIGLDIANYFSYKLGYINLEMFEILHEIILENIEESDYYSFKMKNFFNALKKDKKNYTDTYRFVIPTDIGSVSLLNFPMNKYIDKIIEDYFREFYKKELK